MEEAPGVEFGVMQDALGGDAHRGVRKTGVEGQWELERRGVDLDGIVSEVHVHVAICQFHPEALRR